MWHLVLYDKFVRAYHVSQMIFIPMTGYMSKLNKACLLSFVKNYNITFEQYNSCKKAWLN